MALKNPYGLTLDLQCTGFDSEALSAFSASEAPELPEFPEDDTTSTSTHAAAGAANVRMRIRDSAVLRSEQAAGFALPTPPPEHDPAPEPEPQEQDEHEVEDEDVQDAVKLNFFVHNGYRYDGRLFKLRGPQERSQNSYPRRILQHTPGTVRLNQDFQRVYSEATYNTRPSSLRELRLSARLSATSYTSVSDMLAAADAPPVPLIPSRAAAGAVCSPTTRVSLLVENDLVTQEQASRIRVASPSAPPARAKAPRAVRHIGNENAPPNHHGQPQRKKKKPKATDAKRTTHTLAATEQRKKRQKSSNTASTQTSTPNSTASSRPTRSVLAPSPTNTPNTPTKAGSRRASMDSTLNDTPSGKLRPKRNHHRSPAPKKKSTFWKSLGLK